MTQVKANLKNIYRLTSVCAAFGLLVSASVHAQDAWPLAAVKVSSSLALGADQFPGGRLGGSGTSIASGMDCFCYSVGWSPGNGNATRPALEAMADADFAAVPRWDLQVGRHSLPLYAYSGLHDAGLFYPRFGTSPQSYRYAPGYFDGASVRFAALWGGTSLATRLFAGQEYYSSSWTDPPHFGNSAMAHRKNIAGSDLQWSAGPATMQLTYLRADALGRTGAWSAETASQLGAYGLSAKLDYNTSAWTAAAGLRLGPWKPTLQYAQYVETTTNTLALAPMAFRRTTLDVRYDLNATSAVRAQWDWHTDLNQNFGGNTNLFRLTYDRNF